MQALGPDKQSVRLQTTRKARRRDCEGKLVANSLGFMRDHACPR